MCIYAYSPRGCANCTVPCCVMGLMVACKVAIILFQSCAHLGHAMACTWVQPAAVWTCSFKVMHHSSPTVLDFVPGLLMHSMRYPAWITYSSFLQGSCVFHVCASIAIMLPPLKEIRYDSYTSCRERMS